MKALVHVTLKPDVLDPQGKAIQKASASLGYEAIRSVLDEQLEEGLAHPMEEPDKQAEERDG